MPRKSPHLLHLTTGQRQELEARARKCTLPYRAAQFREFVAQLME
jgi:hypothetical protein